MRPVAAAGTNGCGGGGATPRRTGASLTAGARRPYTGGGTRGESA